MQKNSFLVKVFYFFKIAFDSLFLVQLNEVASFFSFFSAGLTNPLFFYKCITMKKNFIYSVRPKDIFIIKAVRSFNKVNSFLQEQDFSFAEVSKKKKVWSRVFSIQKTFLTFKKISLKKFFYFYKLKLLKRRKLFSLFSNFRKNNFFEIESFFSLGLLRVLHRVFPFFSFHLLKKLVQRGCVLLNFKKINFFFFKLHVGDFLSIFFVDNIWAILHEHLQLQQKYFFKIKKKLFMIASVRAAKNEKTVSSYFSKNFTHLSAFFKKIPGWAEVDFLSFSVFLIKKKHLSSCFFFFNPFLYRLLEYR